MTQILSPAPENDQPQASPRIEVRGLVKTFRRANGASITPVDHIDLTVDSNELVVLLGPSGCGKTTLLRCVAGLERPDEGEIIVNGVTVFSSARGVYVPADQRRLSMVFQSFALWPHMTVAQNIAYPLESQTRMSAVEIRDRVQEILQLVGVGALGDQYPGRISGGQQQRVALARALVSSSTVVLFDEPLSNVDAQVRAQLRFELKRMQKQFGYSGLYVTHDQTEAMELGHRVAVLDNGRIAALGSPRSVYNHPNSEYVANFVGTANIWPAEVMEAGDDGVELDTAAGRLVARNAMNFVGAPETSCLVIVRPERITVSRDEPRSSTNRLPGIVESRVFAGPHTEYVVRCRDAMVRAWSHDVTEGEELDEGGSCWLSVDPSQVTLIEPGKGARP